jgi:hypothetical protein
MRVRLMLKSAQRARLEARACSSFETAAFRGLLRMRESGA